MATPLPPLAERLATELADEISKVKEPYRSNLIIWLNGLAGREIVNLNGDMAAWLAELGGFLMIDQYALIRIVCQEAERYFGTRRGRR
ncbi:MAG: hypothetical protein ISS57_09520 [Anaerolineales bacterium]|nr:hypothetical protein [Anaerolineales bacterium]